MKYGKHSKVKATHGKHHDFLSMNFRFPAAIIDQKDYVNAMFDNFSVEIMDSEITPAPEDLFSEG